MTEGIGRWPGPTCPSCDAVSEPGERYCWRCGIRLPRRLSAAAVPLAVGVAGLGLFVLLAVLVDSSDAPAATVSTTVVSAEVSSTTATAVAPPEFTVLTVAQIECSQTLPSHPCALLLDGDRSTAWNAPVGGIGAEIIVTLDSPAQLSRLVLTNHAEDGALYRNARIARVIVHFAGSDEVVDVEIEGSHGPYRIPLPLVRTSSISIHVEAIHPAEDYGGEPAYGELALTEIAIIGFPAG